VGTLISGLVLVGPALLCFVLFAAPERADRPTSISSSTGTRTLTSTPS